MGTFMILLAVLICALLAGWFWRQRSRHRGLSWLQTTFSGATTRKLSDDELSAVERYLEAVNQTLVVPVTGSTVAPEPLKLNAHSNTVYALTRAITRYGITTDDLNKWRYFLDSVEVHLPPAWEQYINDENEV